LEENLVLVRTHEKTEHKVSVRRLRNFKAIKYAGESVVSIPTVKDESFFLVMEFMKHYEVDPMLEIAKPIRSLNLADLVQPWYFQFLTSLDEDTQFDLIVAAKDLQYRPLLSLSVAYYATIIKSQRRITGSEVRGYFTDDEWENHSFEDL
jgi:hypothetical protein